MSAELTKYKQVKEQITCTVNFGVKSWNKIFILYIYIILSYCTQTHMVCSYRISWELNKHSRLTNSCCGDISCWLKTQLVTTGGMRNETRVHPQISAEEWPIYIKFGFGSGSEWQGEIHCFSQKPLDKILLDTFSDIYELSSDTCEEAVFALLVWSLVTIFESEADKCWTTLEPQMRGKKRSTVQRGIEQLTGFIIQAQFLQKAACTFNPLSHACWIKLNYV